LIVLDVEILKAIPPRPHEIREPDIEYCAGWRDFANMGVTVVCTYEMDTHLSRTFLEEDLGDLAVYLHGKPTSGFNTRRFDLPLLHEHGVDVDQAQHYDILESIWVAQRLDPDHFVYATHGGWSLDAVCEATLGVKKSGNGAMAPIWWQKGQRGRVIDYCLRDVWLEAKLLRHATDVGQVTTGWATVDLSPPGRGKATASNAGVQS
jgi:hypothetical protein